MPESTGVTSPTGSSSSSTISATSTPSKKSDAGTIAGAVIGGIALFFIAAIVAMYLRRRQRRRRGAHSKAPSAMVDIEDTKPRPYLTTLGSNTNTGTEFHASIPTMSTVPKLYVSAWEFMRIIHNLIGFNICRTLRIRAHSLRLFLQHRL